MDSVGAGVTSLVSLSDDGEYAARLDGKDLFIQSHSVVPELREEDIIRTKDTASSIKFLKFSPTESALRKNGTDLDSNRRLLCASDDHISIWQLKPLCLYAEIENLEPGALNIEFGSDENEVIMFHAWNTKVTLFTLDTKRSQVIKTPKFSNASGFGYRPKTRQLAILLKPETTDILTIHERRSYELINKANLSTVDAQGLKWSPDGKWIAVWEVASAGTKVFIFTADGQHLKTYTGPPGFDDSFDLGVRNTEWSPVADGQENSEFLAVGKYDGNVDILRSKTFSCSISLSHTLQVDQPSATFWRERNSTVNGDVEYAESAASTITAEPSGSTPRGVSTMAFSYDGGLLGTVDQLRPNIVWIWSLRDTTRLVSALVHEHAVRQVVWHPWKTELLISTASGAGAAVRYWAPNSNPAIVRIPISRSDTGRYEVRWSTGTSSRQNDHSVFWFGTGDDYVVGHLGVQDGILKFDVLRFLNSKGDGPLNFNMNTGK